MLTLWMIGIGAMIGALSRVVLPRRDPGGVFVTVPLGAIGALFGGQLGLTARGFHAAGVGPVLVAAALGAVFALIAYRSFPGHARARL